jgi:hypothetical protein
MNPDTNFKPRVPMDNNSKHNKLPTRNRQDVKDSDASIQHEGALLDPVKPKKKKRRPKKSTKPRTEKTAGAPAETEQFLPSDGVELSQADISNWINMLKGSAYSLRSQAKHVGCNWKRSHHQQRHEADEQTRRQARSKDSVRHGSQHKSKASKQASKDRHIFPFLALPRELRDMIYEYTTDLSSITQNVKNEHKGFYDDMRFINQKKERQRWCILWNDLKIAMARWLRRPSFLSTDKFMRKLFAFSKTAPFSSKVQQSTIRIYSR